MARAAARATGRRGHEPVQAVHPAADRDLAVDGGGAARRHRRLPPAPRVGAAGGGLSDDPGDHLLSRRQPGRDGLRRHRAAGAPVRPGAGPEPDDLDQLRGGVDHHPAVHSRSRHRRRRAAGAGGDQRRRHLPAARPAEPAGLQQDEPGGRPGAHPGADLEDAAALEGGGPRRYPPGAEGVAAPRRRPGADQRRPEAGGAHPGQPHRALGLRADAGGRAHRGGRRQRQPGQGELRRRPPVLHHRRQRPAPVERSVQAADRRLQERRPGGAFRRRRRDRFAPRT